MNPLFSCAKKYTPRPRGLQALPRGPPKILQNLFPFQQLGGHTYGELSMHTTKNLTLQQLHKMFSTETKTHRWWVHARWPNGVACPHCGSLNIQKKTTHPSQPFRCRDCRKFFSVKTGTCMESSKLSLRVWAIAIYLVNTHPKGISSLRAAQILGVTQNTAWFLLHRIREAYDDPDPDWFEGPVECDEVWIGGREKNKHFSKRRKGSQGGSGKAIIVGMKDRKTNKVVASVIPAADQFNLKHFVWRHANLPSGCKVYTDERRGYRGLPNHSRVIHRFHQYVRGEVHTNGIESFWALLRRGYHGTYHWMSFKHLQRYVNEFVGRYNGRPLDTIAQMGKTVAGLDGKRLRYCDLVGSS